MDFYKISSTYSKEHFLKEVLIPNFRQKTKHEWMKGKKNNECWMETKQLWNRGYSRICHTYHFISMDLAFWLSSFTFWNFLEFLFNIFTPWLVGSMDVKPEDTKSRLYILNAPLNIGDYNHSICKALLKI